MKTKLQKGTYGYLNRNKWNEWKKALLMLAVPIAIFLAAWMIKGTRLNLITVAAIVGCIPGCNQVVHAIVASRYHSMDKDLYEATEAARGELPVLYENVFTSYEKNYYIDCVVIAGRDVIGYSSDEKLTASQAAEHIQKILRDNSYKQNVRILKEKKAFLERVHTLASSSVEEVPFHGDERYPDMSRDEIIQCLLMAISL